MNTQTHARLAGIARAAATRARRSNVAHITPEIYTALADELRDRINNEPYELGQRVKALHGEAIDLEAGEYVFTLSISAVVHVDEHTTEEGSWTTVAGVVPTWCEVHAYRLADGGEVRNDFDFGKLEKRI